MTKKTTGRATNPTLVSLIAFVLGALLGGLLGGVGMRRYIDHED
jgi:hypothetical protein